MEKLTVPFKGVAKAIHMGRAKKLRKKMPFLGVGFGLQAVKPGKWHPYRSEELERMVSSWGSKLPAFANQFMTEVLDELDIDSGRAELLSRWKNVFFASFEEALQRKLNEWLEQLCILHYIGKQPEVKNDKVRLSEDSILIVGGEYMLIGTSDFSLNQSARLMNLEQIRARRKDAAQSMLSDLAELF